MKKIFLFIAIIVLTACSSSDISGTYTCTRIKYYNTLKTPSEIADKQEELEYGGLGRPITVTVYDNSIYVDCAWGADGRVDHDGFHMEKRSNNEYYGHNEYGTTHITATFSGKTLYLKAVSNQDTDIRECWAERK